MEDWLGDWAETLVSGVKSSLRWMTNGKPHGLTVGQLFNVLRNNLDRVFSENF